MLPVLGKLHRLERRHLYESVADKYVLKAINSRDDARRDHLGKKHDLEADHPGM